MLKRARTTKHPITMQTIKTQTRQARARLTPATTPPIITINDNDDDAGMNLLIQLLNSEADAPMPEGAPDRCLDSHECVVTLYSVPFAYNFKVDRNPEKEEEEEEDETRESYADNYLDDCIVYYDDADEVN